MSSYGPTRGAAGTRQRAGQSAVGGGEEPSPPADRPAAAAAAAAGVAPVPGL